MKKFSLLVCVILFTIEIYTQNFWQQTNGPYIGATVNDFLSYNDSIIFLASTEGIIKSSDKGETWARIYESPINCLAKDQLGVLYAAENYLNGNYYILRSTNEGNSWNRLNISIWPNIREILIPYKDTIFLATVNYGVCRSTDNGNTWIQMNSSIDYPNIFTVSLLSNGHLLAGTSGGGIYKSTDLGSTWSQCNNGITPFSTGYIFVRTICEITPGEIMIGAQNKMYYSSDYGETWVERSNGFGVGTVNCIIKRSDGVLYAGSSGFYKGVHHTTDNGNQWFQIGLDYPIFSLGLDYDSMLYAGSLSDGLYKLIDNDTTWVQIYNQGYTLAEVLKLALSENGNLIASTRWYGIFKTTNNGLEWEQTSFKDLAYSVESINDSIIIAVANDLFVSIDTGVTWTKTFNALYGFSSMYYDIVQKVLYAGSYGILYKSTDFGFNWDEIASFTPKGYIDAIYATSIKHTILIAAYYPPGPNTYYRFFQSTDQGLNWELIFGGIDIEDIIGDSLQNVYAVGNRIINISSDEGMTWTSNTTPSSFTDFIELDNEQKILFIGDDSGLYYSTDNGIQWIVIDHSGLNASMYRDMKVNQQGLIFLATTNGVYVGHVDNIILSIDEPHFDISFYLSHNYPNPFNPSTSIQYAVSSRDFVTLKVYDVLGSEVATLVNEEKQPGVYEVEFNGSNLSSGIYFYKLQTENYSETKKMQVIK